MNIQPAAARRATAATPPTTPPAIAPTGVEPWESFTAAESPLGESEGDGDDEEDGSGNPDC